MDRYAVIGQPVGHSLSPGIHQAFAAHLGVKIEYTAIEIAPDRLAEELQRLHAEGFRGLNVTLPHKLAAFAICAESSDAAVQAGSVNTLIRTDAGWRGNNTDGIGLVRDLRENQELSLAGKKILLLGAGGAVRGILKPLLDMKPAELVLSNRNPWKPEKLAEEFKAFGNIRPCTHLALKGDRFDLIINATSAGHSGEMPRLPGQLLAEGGVCYDLSYGAAHQPFRRWAEAQSAALIRDGLGMLVEQAAVAFSLWTGQRPITAAVIEELRHMARV